MTYAVVRVRGTIGVKADISDTLRFLRLNRPNHCVLIPENLEYKGMLRKVKDYVTWGEIQPEILARMLMTRGNVRGKSEVNDAYVKKNSEYKSIIAFAKAVAAGQETLRSLNGLNVVIRLHPPVKGFESTKKPYSLGGALGYRGGNINQLLVNMMFVHED